MWLLAEPYVRDAGFDLIEVQSGREPTGWVVRLFIDLPRTSTRRDGSSAARIAHAIAGRRAVGPHEDCERVSRDVSAALDVADVDSSRLPAGSELARA